MLLAGDIGGTKTILALYRPSNDCWVCIKKQSFASADFANFDALLTMFLFDQASVLQGICLGVAGPVFNGRCQTTNLPWLLEEASISSKFGVENVTLLNDLEATAWRILKLSEKQIVELNPSSNLNYDASAAQHIAVIAAGTGLGEAIIIQQGSKNYVIAGEGGHTDFAPNSEQELALLLYLRKKYPEHVSYERIISGEGLANIYQFLKAQGEGCETADFAQRLQSYDPAAVIGNAGVLQENELSSKAVNLFCKIYGAEAANLALKCLPFGGLYLAGGIATKLLLVLQQGHFMEGFLAKGRYRSVLQQIPVKVCLNNECALEGALAFAQENLSRCSSSGRALHS